MSARVIRFVALGARTAVISLSLALGGCVASSPADQTMSVVAASTADAQAAVATSTLAVSLHCRGDLPRTTIDVTLQDQLRVLRAAGGRLTDLVPQSGTALGARDEALGAIVEAARAVMAARGWLASGSPTLEGVLGDLDDSHRRLHLLDVQAGEGR